MADGAPSSAKSSVDILTLGCRLNSYESEVMRGHAEAAGLQDAVIVNTCAVTAEAVRQARQTIRRARRERPTASIIVTGCAAQIDPASFAEMPEVSRVIGNAEKMKAETFKPIDFVGEVERVQVNDIMTVREVAAHLVDGLDGRARAFVQVQTGCDHRCTFCIIPYGRGNSRSVPAGEVIDQVKRLVATGHYEIVLTGVDLTSWGADLPNAPKLGNLVTRILKLVPDLKQLRLSSIDAIEIDEPLFEALAHAISLCNRLREARPEMAFGADLIAGFPTETDEMFANTLASVDECGIDYLHVFPYSPRPGTPAAKMPQVARDIVKARAATLREKGAARLNLRLNRHVGLTAMALVEAGNRARLPDFAPVRIDGASPEPGRPALFNLVSRSATELVGQLA